MRHDPGARLPPGEFATARRVADFRPLDYYPGATPGRPALRFVIALALLITAGLAVGALLLPAEPAGEGAADGESALRPVFAATLTTHLAPPEDGSWANAAALAVVNGKAFLGGGGQSAVVEIDAEGRASSLPSRRVRALNAQGGELLAASAAEPQVLVLAPDGRTRAVLNLPLVFDGAHAEPAGLVRTPDGNLWVADAGTGRLLVLDSSGALAWSLGGDRDEPRYLLQPGALAAAPDGTVYLADVVAGTVYRVASHFPFPRLEEGARPGAQIYEPVGLAVDREGRVYVVDALLGAVQVFDAEGGYLGRLGPASDTDPILKQPAAVFADGDSLYVLDHSQGLLTFAVP